MKKNPWIIIAIAVLCLAALGVTILCVVGGVQSVLPKTEEPKFEVTSPPTDAAQGDVIVPIDPVTGAPIEDNTVVDPWGEIEEDDPIGSTPIEELPTEESPEEEAEEEIDMEEWSTSDEGWTAIY